MSKQGFPRKSEFAEWLEHPVTKVVLEMGRAEREQYRQDWEGGSFTDYSKDAAILVNVGNLGTCKGIALFTDLTYVKLATKLEVELTEEELKDD